MQTVELHVEPRTGGGKGKARRLRATKHVPAILYGRYMNEAIPMSVSTQELARVAKLGSNAMLTFKTEAKSDLNGKLAVLKERQVHPVTDAPVHVDFQEIRMDEAIKVSVPLVLTGKAKGVAEGGILQQIRRELEVRCLPTQVPEKIEVDVTELEVGYSIHVKEVALPSGVEVMGTVNFTLAAVVPPEKEEVVAPTVLAEGEVPLEGAAEGEEKKEGEAPSTAESGKAEEKAEAKSEAKK